MPKILSARAQPPGTGAERLPKAASDIRAVGDGKQRSEEENKTAEHTGANIARNSCVVPSKPS